MKSNKKVLVYFGQDPEESDKLGFTMTESSNSILTEEMETNLIKTALSLLLEEV